MRQHADSPYYQLDSTGEVLVMYWRHFGTIPVKMTGAPEPLDVAAAWTADRTALTISIVNPTFETQWLAFRVESARLASQGTAWVLTAASAPTTPDLLPVLRTQGLFLRDVSTMGTSSDNRTLRVAAKKRLRQISGSAISFPAPAVACRRRN